jgi:transposase
MVKTNQLKPHHISVLHYWNMGIRCARKIHQETKIPLSKISYQLKKLRTQGSSEYQPGNGRKRVIGPKYSRAVGQFIRRINEATLTELAEKLRDQCSLTVSISTISRHLHRHGYQNCLPLNTPMLTDEQKKRRVQWAEEHLKDNWKFKIFTDECSFQLFRNTIRRCSKYPKKEKKRVPKNRQKVHVWGAISYKGLVGLHSFQNIMNSDYYIEILENNFIDNATRQFNNKWQLQQDNDPKHQSSTTKKWLDENVPQVLDWPSNSPDLNPIENLWNIVKHRTEKRKTENINELKHFLHEEWENIEKKIIINLINSMKKRCHLVIESKGERIEY